MPLPDCAGKVELTQAHVVRVEKDGALILPDGRGALLEGLRLPGWDQPLAPIAVQAIEALRALVTRAPLTVTTTAPESDRYGRLRVQAFSDVWLQVELLRRGLARVAIMPDRQECSPDFYEAEIEARQAGRGLWALPEFAVRKAKDFSAPEGSFQIVEGHVFNVASPGGRMFLDFDPDFRKGFSAIIAPEDRKAFRNSDPALEELVGRDIRVRGILTNFNGRPEIALFNPRQIELLK
ncbi:MAG TPA: thermonuclease family protein [Rhizomicrobium sp.]|nr:thermonuclease family protein [Rhizomicrobium sp.]